MSLRARDPAESTAQLLALAATAMLTVVFLVAKVALPAGRAIHGLVDHAQLSVIAPQKDQPAPQPKVQKRAPMPVRHVRLLTRAVPAMRSVHVESPTPQPFTDPAETAPAAVPPAAASPSVGHPDPNLAYEAALRSNIVARTCGPDTPEYRLLHPTGTSRVSFFVDRAGAVSSVQIAGSSGSEILDKQAYAIVSQGNYPRMPADVFAGETSHPFLVEIEFRRGGGCAP